MSISGVISGLQTDDIITKIMDFAKRPQNQLKNQKTTDQLKLATWQDLNTKVLTVQMKASALATQNSFTSNTVKSSDEGVLTATAGPDAAVGTYYIRVVNRAQAHQIAGEAKGDPPTPFTSTTADIGTGTLSFTFGSGPDRDTSKDFTVSIDGNNNTLIGARDAINKANKGVQATIVNTGTSSSPSYQLLLTSTTTGEASQFSVDGGATSLDFSTVTQTGRDANIELGDSSGASAIAVHKASNTITDLIPGVTLNLVDAAPGKMLTVNVSRDTAATKTAIQDFVSAFNELNKAISDQFVVDPTTGQGGPLLGDWDLQNLQQSLMSTLTQTVPGVDKDFSSLAAVGITLNMSGSLQIEDSTLTNAINTAPDKVTSLFAAGMQSDSSYVSYVTSNADTQSSGPTGWSVDVTQAARRAQVTAAYEVPVGGLGNSETLTVGRKNGNTTAISLSQEMTLSQIVDRINSYSATSGVAAVATKADGTVSNVPSENTFLTLRSVMYGSATDITAFSSRSNADDNSAATTGIGTKEVSAASPGGESEATRPGVGLLGLDVVGTINGDSATGYGQVLTAKPSTNGMPQTGFSVMVTSDGPMSTRVYYTKGIGTLMRDMLSAACSSSGIVSKAQDSLNSEMADLDKSIADWDTRLQDQQDRLSAQFSAMESQLAQLQDQGNYLASQISAMNKK